MGLRFSPERIYLTVENIAVYPLDEHNPIVLDDELRAEIRDMAHKLVFGTKLDLNQHEAIERFVRGKISKPESEQELMEQVDNTDCKVGVIGGIPEEFFSKDRFNYARVLYSLGGLWNNDSIDEAYPGALAVIEHVHPIVK